MRPEDLKALLIESGRSQRWLARQLGVAENTISGWATGRMPIPAVRDQPIRGLLENPVDEASIRADQTRLIVEWLCGRKGYGIGAFTSANDVRHAIEAHFLPDRTATAVQGLRDTADRMRDLSGNTCICEPGGMDFEPHDAGWPKRAVARDLT